MSAEASAASTEGASPKSAEVQGARRRRILGTVLSNKMDKTVVVEVVRYQMEPIYKKYVKVRKRYKAHDEANEYRAGDRIEMIEHRPLSKQKRFKVTRLIERPALADEVKGS